MVYLGTASNGAAAKSSNGTPNGSAAASSTHEDMNGSPNGNGRASVESASDDEREGRIRVGKDYQAVTPNFIEVESKCAERLWTMEVTVTLVNVLYVLSYRQTPGAMSGESSSRLVTRRSTLTSKM